MAKTWQDRFDRLLEAMTSGKPHKAEKRVHDSHEEKQAERHSNRKSGDNS